MNRAKFEDYDAFVEKFKVKKTTDECWTPPEIYDVVRDWACAEYGIDAAKIVRPFCPGGDYEGFDYSGGKVVLDNPPFSILSRILSFYLDRGIPFFLFAPGLTAFSSGRTVGRACRILVDGAVVYANGAVVQTAFVTSYDAGCALRTAPELSRRLRDKVAELSHRGKKKLRSYDFPPQLLRASVVSRLARLGVDFRVPADECAFVSRLDAMPNGVGVFGGALLVSDRVAAEYAAARAKSCADVIPLELSERERAIVASLARGKNCRGHSLAFPQRRAHDSFRNHARRFLRIFRSRKSRADFFCFAGTRKKKASAFSAKKNSVGPFDFRARVRVKKNDARFRLIFFCRPFAADFFCFAGTRKIEAAQSLVLRGTNLMS